MTVPQRERERIGPFVVTGERHLDPRGICCAHCLRLLSTLDRETDTHTPSCDDLMAQGALAISNFGWFCSTECRDAYEREFDVRLPPPEDSWTPQAATAPPPSPTPERGPSPARVRAIFGGVLACSTLLAAAIAWEFRRWFAEEVARYSFAELSLALALDVFGLVLFVACCLRIAATGRLEVAADARRAFRRVVWAAVAFLCVDAAWGAFKTWREEADWAASVSVQATVVAVEHEPFPSGTIHRLAYEYESAAGTTERGVVEAPDLLPPAKAALRTPEAIMARAREGAVPFPIAVGHSRSWPARSWPEWVGPYDHEGLPMLLMLTGIAQGAFMLLGFLLCTAAAKRSPRMALAFACLVPHLAQLSLLSLLAAISACFRVLSS